MKANLTIDFLSFQDCHGKNNQDMRFEGLVQDDTQNYVLENEGYQNLTHTVITFRRALETCDPRDVPLTVRRSQWQIMLSTDCCELHRVSRT